MHGAYVLIAIEKVGNMFLLAILFYTQLCKVECFIFKQNSSQQDILFCICKLVCEALMQHKFPIKVTVYETDIPAKKRFFKKYFIEACTWLKQLI